MKRSPSNIYINGPDTIYTYDDPVVDAVSSTMSSSTLTTAGNDEDQDVRDALEAALGSVFKGPCQVDEDEQHEFYYFDESFDMEEELNLGGAAVVVSMLKTNDDDDPCPGIVDLALS